MSTVSSPPLDPDAIRAGEELLNHFAASMSERTELVHPVTSKAVRFTKPIQMPRLRFGNLRRCNYRGGVPGLKATQSELAVVAIALNEEALEMQNGTLVAPHDVVQRIEQPAGVDVEPTWYYLIGVYSPVGWPAGRTRTIRTANATYWFISRHPEATGAWWEVAHVNDEFRAAFNPESDDEEAARATRALAQEPELQPGSSKVMDGDEFCEKFHVSSATVARAATESKGAYMIVSRGGRTIITRR